MKLLVPVAQNRVVASAHPSLKRQLQPFSSGLIIKLKEQLSICGAACCAAAFCGAILACQPVQAYPLHQLVVLDTRNAAILQDLKRLTKTKDRFGTQEPTAVLSTRFLGAQQQLQRIELLVKIGQYDNARMQLREGSFKTMRMDLGYGQEMYRVVKPEAVRAVVEGIEQLDGQLKRKEPAESIKPQLEQLKAQLADLAELFSSLGQ